MALESLLIKPVGPRCNLECTYCFYLEKDVIYPESPTMEEDLLRRTISQYMKSSGQPIFSWQGGEPTLAGVDFFRRVIDLQKKFGHPGQRIGNALQTNGTLIDESWASFLSKNKFLVGLSLDGPRELHDYYRSYPNGDASFERVMDTAKLLRDYGVEFTVLSVLNNRTVKQPKRILNFFLDQGFYNIQFIPAIELITDERSGQNGETIAPFSPTPLEVGKFLDQIFQEWKKHFPPPFNVRYFDALIRKKLGWDPQICKLRPKCTSYLVVEHNGDLYPCDFFVENRWNLGNLKGQTFQDTRSEKRFREFVDQSARLPSQCKSCKYLDLCQGGCPRYRDIPGGPKDVTYLCEGYKYFLSRNGSAINTITSKIKNKG